MRVRPVNSRTGRTGACALAGALLAACGHQEPATLQVLGVEEIDSGWRESRQVAVKVDAGGAVAWDGKRVSREELGGLMRQAALGSPELLLVVAAGSGDVKYGDLVQVMQMASSYGIETRLAGTEGDTE